MADELEQQVCARIAERERDLVALLQALIRFDTTTHIPGAPARHEAAVQAHIAERLRGAGASVDVSEPDPGLIAGHRMVPEGFTFSGRPQLVARFAGTGGRRTLLLNGHVDVVDPEPLDAWDHPPFDGVVAGGTVRGRGACDMKGGVACMVFAAEVLAELGVRLAGDCSSTRAGRSARADRPWWPHQAWRGDGAATRAGPQ